MKAKKHFGQHFLTNQDTAKRIVEALGDRSQDSVLEIGPGMGILTQFLRECTQDFKVVEIDDEAADLIEEKWPDQQIVRGDFLKVDLGSIFERPFHLIGNFPYNISSQIVFKILEHPELVRSWVGMFQLEMGNRLIAVPNNKQYGILSVLLPFYYKVEKVMVLPPGAFSPPPKIKSIVLKAEPSGYEMRCSKDLLYRVVKLAFNQRRKVLSNSLSSLIPKDVLNRTQFANLRPENLDHVQFEELCLYIEDYVSSRGK